MAISMVMMLGFCALTIDSGRLYVARNELQNAADSAALAAATAMASTANQKQDTSTVQQNGYSIGLTFSEKHKCDGKSISLIQSQVNFGRLDNPNDLKEPFNTNTTNYNAVQVTAQRSNASNGLLDLTFARIWGLMNTSVSASAVAVLDDHMSGYKPISNNNGGAGPLLPITMPATDWAKQATSGADNWSFDPNSGKVKPGPDGIPEVDLYPTKAAPGNSGLLDIGPTNNSETDVDNQIVHGIGQDDLTQTTGQPELKFYDDGGNPQTYAINGTTGLKSSLDTPLSARVGTIVAIPVNSAVVLNGANATYTITGLRFGRLMEVELKTGKKHVMIQPTFYSGSDILTDPDAPSTNLNASNIHLAR